MQIFCGLCTSALEGWVQCAIPSARAWNRASASAVRPPRGVRSQSGRGCRHVFLLQRGISENYRTTGQRSVINHISVFVSRSSTGLACTEYRAEWLLLFRAIDGFTCKLDQMSTIKIHSYPGCLKR
jgi:hypothetical protein